MEKKIAVPIIGLLLIMVCILNSSNEIKDLLSFEHHYKKPWKVHRIAKDFQLLDLWEFPILADPDQNQDFHFFLRILLRNDDSQRQSFFSPRYLIAKFLIIIRGIIGKIFHLDEHVNVLPIPGTQQKSVKERMSEKDLEYNLAEKFMGGEKDIGKSGFRLVYLFEKEALWELSINHVHVLMHYGWVYKENGFYTARLAVYAKTRGILGESYLKLIMPFRRYIIYPVMLDVVKIKWGKALMGNFDN